jgi:DNA polymerase-1
LDLGVVAIGVESPGIDPMQAGLCGIALALAPNEAAYVPLAHRKGGEGAGLFEAGLAPEQIAERDALDALKPLLQDPGVLKVGHDLKFAWQMLAQRGIELAPHDDTLLLSYALDAGRSGHELGTLAGRYFGHTTIEANALTGTGKARLTFDCVEIAKAAEYAAEAADMTLRLWSVLKARLVAEHMATVYETLERPLVPVLARMERRGISIDRQVLSRLSGEFAQRGAALEAEVPAVPSSLATSCSARWACPAAPKQKPANGRPARACSTTWPSRATNCRKRFSNGGR